MKILYFTTPVEDYLGDAVLLGLRQLYGEDVIDYPKCDILYDNCPENIRQQVRGNGFTLYSGLLEDIEIDRFNIEYKLQNDYYDIIIFSDIQRQFGLFVHFRPFLKPGRTIIMDGFDTSQPYPARGRWWRRPYYWFLPMAHHHFPYFKREWTTDTYFYLWMRILPAAWRKRLQPKNLQRIAFSIPDDKIVKVLPVKLKNFPKHIVDLELAARLPDAFTSYAFSTEQDYYKDLQESRFGITTKRAGWDCLRHYEIAANGTVMCFRDLHKKPDTCAPHGLIDGHNCIAYTSVDELMAKIETIGPEQYKQLQRMSWQWAKDNSSLNRAKSLLTHSDVKITNTSTVN